MWAGVGMVARAELRGRWRALCLLAVIVGLGAGITFSLAAGARRTASVVDRFRDARQVADLVVQPEAVTGKRLADLRDEPSVAAVAQTAVVFSRVKGSDTELLSDDQLQVTVALDDVYGSGLDRPPVIAGDPLDPTDPGAAEISEAVADRYQLEPGDRLVLETLSAEEVLAGIFAGEPPGAPDGPELELRVSGVTRPTNELLGLTEEGTIVLTPALWEEHGDPITRDGEPTFGRGAGGFTNIVLVRTHDGDVDGATSAANRIFADDRELFLEQTAELAAGITDLARVVAISLAIAAAAVAVTTAVVTVQAITRHLTGRSNDVAALAAIGMPVGARVVGVVLPVIGAVAASGLVAIAVALAVSSRFPFGELRRLEPDPSIYLDGVVLAAGGAATVVLLAVTAWVAARRGQRPRPTAPRVAPAAFSKAPMLVTTGAGLATGGRAPVRPALGGAIVALAGLAAAATMGASLARFVDEPARDGWAWDADVGMGDGLDDAAALAAARDIAGHEIVEGVLLVRTGALPAGPNGNATQVFGLAPVAGDVSLTMLDGRPARALDEVVLGADTADARDAGIGDRIRVDGLDRAWSLRVTGIARFPVLDSDSPADGMAMSLEALARIAPTTEDGPFGFPSAFVDLAPGVDLREASRVLGDQYSIFNEPLRSTDVTNLEEVVGIAPFVAVVLGVLGALALAHAVIVATRRQRRDLAVLRGLGFVRRQIWSLVGVQAAAYCLAGVLVGVPLGIVVGRWTWRLLADQLGAADDPLTPAVLVLAAPATVLLMALLAAVAGWFNARGSPALELRAE